MADSDKTLKLLIELGYVGKDKADEAKAALAGLAKTSDEQTEATKKSTAASAQDAEQTKQSKKEVEGLDLGKRELLESLRELTRQYPLLGEIARSVFNPLTVATFGVAEAVTIWIERMKVARELLGGWELPDFTAHSIGVSAAAEQYEKLSSAVRDADEAFNGAAAAFERQEKAISAQLAAIKQLLAAQKENAIADLDVERAGGKLSPGLYNAKKAAIEEGYNDQTTQAEIDARNADLAAKKQEAANLAKQSADEAAKAANIQPGLNDAAMGGLIDEAKAAAEEAKKKAEEFRQKEALAKQMQAQEGLESFTPESITTQLKYDTTFGVTTNPAEQAKIAAEAAKKAESTQAVAEEQVRQLEKQQADRKKHAEEAARLAAEAEKTGLELQGEDDPNKPGSVAWQNAQAVKAQGARDVASEESAFAKDVDAFNKDASEYTRNAGKADPQSIAKARQAIADMYAMVTDAFGIMQHLAGEHQNIAELRRRINEMERTLGAHDGQFSSSRNWQGGQG